MEKQDPNANVEASPSPFTPKREKKKRDIKFEYARIPVFREYMQTQLKQIQEIEKEAANSTTLENSNNNAENNNATSAPHQTVTFNFENSLDDFVLYCMLAGLYYEIDLLNSDRK